MQKHLIAGMGPIALLLLTGPGCGTNEGQATLDGGGCEETITTLGVDEVSALGFSAEEILLLAEKTHEETLAYVSGDTTDLTITIARDDGEIRFVDSEPKVDDTDGDLELAAPYCQDRLEIDAGMDFVTADGQFAEHFDVTLRATNADEATVSVRLDPSSLAGGFVVEVPEGAEGYDEVEMSVDASFDQAGSDGRISVQFSGSEEDSSTGEGVAWATSVVVGEWPPPEEGFQTQ